MEFKTFVFYFLSAVLVFASLRVVTLRNPVHAALSLVVTLVAVAVLFAQQQAHLLTVEARQIAEEAVDAHG